MEKSDQLFRKLERGEELSQDSRKIVAALQSSVANRCEVFLKLAPKYAHGKAARSDTRAFNLGYYETPRRIGSKELAAEAQC